MLAAENYSLEQLAGLVEKEFSDLVKVSGKRKEFLILEQAEGKDRRSVLERIAVSSIVVERFGSYEPSLNDIFVNKVGEDA